MDIMKTSFDFAQKWEGGAKYTNDPRDPGGPTKYGIALNYNKDMLIKYAGKADAEAVKSLTEEIALKIYEEKYWKPCKCGQLPDGLAFMYADICFNIGQGAAPKLLQKALNNAGANVDVDGIVGPQTLAAVKSRKEGIVAGFLHNERLTYYKTRSGWKYYGKGWTNRAKDCLSEALHFIYTGT